MTRQEQLQAIENKDPENKGYDVTVIKKAVTIQQFIGMRAGITWYTSGFQNQRGVKLVKVYIVVNNGKACYDCSGVFEGVFRTREKAEQYLQKWNKYDRQYFDIEEHEIEDQQQ